MNVGQDWVLLNVEECGEKEDEVFQSRLAEMWRRKKGRHV